MELDRINVESWINPEVWQQITCWHGLSQTYLPDSLWRIQTYERSFSLEGSYSSFYLHLSSVKWAELTLQLGGGGGEETLQGTWIVVE